MKKSFIFKKSVGLFLLCMTQSFAAHAASISLCADVWMPFSGAADSKEGSGYLTDLARKAFELAGDQVTYQTMKWADCVASVKEGKIDAALGTNKIENPDLAYPQETMFYVGTAFFSLTEKNWQYDGVSSLSKVKLGVAQDYSYGEKVDAYIKEHAADGRVYVSQAEEPVIDLLEQLRTKKVDVFLEAPAVFKYRIKKMKLASDGFKNRGTVETMQSLEIGFSKKGNKSAELIKKFDASILLLKKQGFIKKLEENYIF